MPPTRRLARLLLAAWVTMLFTISSFPDAGDLLDRPWRPPHADKLAPAAGYAVLGALARAGGGPPALLTALAVGAIDEAVIQRIVPERDPDPLDLAADAFGALIGAAVVHRIHTRRGRHA
jgi:hypothetical protein